MMGFDLMPTTYKDVLSPQSYTKWYHMLWVAPILLLMMVGWDFIVVPFRKISKKRKRKW